MECLFPLRPGSDVGDLMPDSDLVQTKGLAMPRIEDCRQCPNRAQCVMGQVDASLQALVRPLLLYQTRLSPGDVLIYPGMPFERLFLVRYGHFKTVLLGSEGQMHTAGLHGGGDVLGLDGLAEGEHQCEVMALQYASVCVFRFDQVCDLSLRVHGVQQALLRALSRSMQRDWQQLLLLGSMDGEERVASFLLMLRQRQATTAVDSDTLDLMMTREEIGNYLGMTLESVSRHLSQFQRRGWIRLDRRRVEIVQPTALQDKRDRRQGKLSPRLMPMRMSA